MISTLNSFPIAFDMKAVRIIFIFAIILAVAEGLYFYPLLPDRIAVHFNAAVTANGWGSKTGFFQMFGVVIVLIAILFGGFGLLIRLIPDALINLPNKDYWLAPERREETRDRIAGQLLIMGTMTMLLLDGVLFVSLKANLAPTPALPSEWMWGMLIAYALGNIIWTVKMLLSFCRPS